MRSQNRDNRRRQRGVTLIEMLVVLTIIALFAALVGPRVLGNTDKARIVTAKAQIAKFKEGLTMYKTDTGIFPSTEQGLQALWAKPSNVGNWSGPYMDQEIPGEHGDVPDLVCLGADGQPGGEGINADIVSWKLQ